jgi:hypothetical protein
VLSEAEATRRTAKNSADEATKVREAGEREQKAADATRKAAETLSTAAKAPMRRSVHNAMQLRRWRVGRMPRRPRRVT